MPRKNSNTRRQHHQHLTTSKIVKILGYKPGVLTKKTSYVRKSKTMRVQSQTQPERVASRTASGKMRTKVLSQDYAKEKEEVKKMGMDGIVEVIPTDMYGKRTMYPKGTNLKEVQEDIREVQALD